MLQIFNHTLYMFTHTNFIVELRMEFVIQHSINSMLNTNFHILLSTGILASFTLWGLAPLSPILVELFIVLQEYSHIQVSIAEPWTLTSPLCRSVFTSVYQYTAKCALRTAVITSYISRYSSMKCSSSKPYFRISLNVTHSEHRIKILSL
jgi:hypothetical protein